MATRVFSLYRYQILPLDTRPSLLYNLQDLIDRKNQYFMEALLSLKISGKNGNRRRYRYELVCRINNFVMMITSRQKNVKVIREDHTPADVDSFPFSYIIFDNEKEYQFVAVQESPELHARTIVKKLEKSLQEKLKARYLTVKFSPVYKESDFWVFARENEGKIISLSFSLITPNMSNISSMLSEDLKRTAKVTAAIETNLRLKSDSSSSLNLQPDNDELNGLVNYAAEGGGEIRAKVRDSTLSFQSNDYQAVMEIGEMEFEGDLSSLVKLIRREIAQLNRHAKEKKDKTDAGDNR